MDKSVFTDKLVMPDDTSLRDVLGDTYELWQEIKAEVKGRMAGVEEQWSYGGDKFGWSFRLKDKKRAIIYLLPRAGFFKVSMVFGQKAYEQITASDVPDFIKEELAAARVYAEGRGIRMIVDAGLKDAIKVLIGIKMSN